MTDEEIADESAAVFYRRRPPRYAIEAAVYAATRSPCAKSKRGAALYNVEEAERAATGVHPLDKAGAGIVVATGFNGPPASFVCRGDAACREACSKICLHAEDRAIRASGILDDVHDLDLVHAKVVDGVLVPGGGPSCWQCSRTVAEVGLRGVWLYEEQQSDPCPPGMEVARLHGSWRYYTAIEFHIETLRHLSLPAAYVECGKYLGDNDATCPQLTCIRPRGHHDHCDNVRP